MPRQKHHGALAECQRVIMTNQAAWDTTGGPWRITQPSGLHLMGLAILIPLNSHLSFSGSWGWVGPSELLSGSIQQGSTSWDTGVPGLL